MSRKASESRVGRPETTGPRATRVAPAGAGRATAGRRSQGRRAPTDSIRILCVDDHPLIVEGLEALFSIDGGCQIVGRLRTADRLLPEVGRLQPEVVLLDIEMPGIDAFETAERLRNIHPAARVIVLSGHIRDGYISAAFKAGACGYFSKADDLDALVAGIRDVAASPDGVFLLGPKVQERCRPLHARPATRSDTPGTAEEPPGPVGERAATSLESLTSRETEVLRLIGKGLSRVQIAAQLSRSVKTIDAHQDHLMKKLGIPARADLMRFAIREGLAQA